MPSTQDTIAAISTPLGEGGIGIVRLSGPKAIKIADKLFKGKDGIPPSKLSSYTIHYGHIVFQGEVLDEVILSIMRKPKSYTREDIVEINCHSGIVPLRKVLEATLECGARIAEPGEFTKRAFLNGRIDLTQAEAVLDIVKAKTELALKTAVSQLKGEFSRKVRELREEIVEILTLIEAELDFPEEDVEVLRRDELLRRIKKIVAKTIDFIEGSKEGEILREGVLVLLVGKANVGKSTLLNRIVGKERAIVTDIPGTTRDSIEELVNIGGVPVRIVDTAGFKKTENMIDEEAQKRVKEYLKEADLIIFMVDGSSRLTLEDRKIARLIGERRALALINKIDLPQKLSKEEVKTLINNDTEIFEVSALKGERIDSLLHSINKMVLEGKILTGEGQIMANARHRECLKGALKILQRASKALGEGLGEELLAFDLREASALLDKILGEAIDEDILNRIFEKFCIGK